MPRLPLLALLPAALLLPLAIVGCGPATPTVAEAPVDRLAPATLYPMPEGAQWVYDVDTGGDEPPTLGIYEVVEVHGEQHRIANNRGMNSSGTVRYSEPVTYEAVGDGIVHVPSGTHVLRAPIADDAEWPAMGGRTAHVTNLEASADVPAGSYEHCVEVTESGGEDGRTVRTIYCPLVGPVLIESSLTSELTQRRVETSARLRSYDDGTDVF